MNLEQLIEAARKAIIGGHMEEAQKLTAQAKALKELDSLAPTATAESADYKSVKAELDELKSKWAMIEGEPATNKAGHLTIVQDETDKKASMPFATLGEQLKAVVQAARYPSDMDPRLKAQKAVLGQSEGQQSDGGFLVQREFSNELFKIAHETGELASRTRRVTVGANANGLKMNALEDGNRATGSRFGGIRGYWLAEGGTKLPSEIKFRQIELNLKKMAAVLYATDELLQDAPALGSVMQMAASEELAWMLDDAILNGTGAGMPLGILNSPALVSIAKESGQGAATVAFENLLKMWGRLHAPSRRNAVWFMNQDVEPLLSLMNFPIGVGGVPVYLPPGGITDAPNARLFGRPIVITEFNQTAGTVGDIVLADLSQYLVIDKGGIKQDSSIHVQFLTDQTAFRWVYRVDGAPLWVTPLTPARGSNTLSPFVALATRS